MKQFMTLLAIGFISFLQAQNTYVPDDNFEQALIDLGYDSVPLDDYVPTANINTVTTLNLGSKNISDLTGIENFTALVDLDAQHNNLSSVDLSNNVNLENLNLNNNNLTTIDVSSLNALKRFYIQTNVLTGLDVSNNANLTNLFCPYNNITSLNITNCTALYDFTCNYNDLTTLDVSTNTSLMFFYCKNNELNYLNLKNGNNINITGFDARNNPNLTCILVDDATWSTTNWTQIDPTSTFVNNQAECDALSISDDKLEASIRIFPNPSKDYIHIDVANDISINHIAIYDISGKIVYQSQDVAEINVRDLNTGIYLVKISGEKAVSTHKIMISK